MEIRRDPHLYIYIKLFHRRISHTQYPYYLVSLNCYYPHLSWDSGLFGCSQTSKTTLCFSFFWIPWIGIWSVFPQIYLWWRVLLTTTGSYLSLRYLHCRDLEPNTPFLHRSMWEATSEEGRTLRLCPILRFCCLDPWFWVWRLEFEGSRAQIGRFRLTCGWLSNEGTSHTLPLVADLSSRWWAHMWNYSHSLYSWYHSFWSVWAMW